MKEKNWEKKEQRELFCKTVNSIIMNQKLGKGSDVIAIEEILDMSKKVVDKAFALYPSEEEDKEVDFKYNGNK